MTTYYWTGATALSGTSGNSVYFINANASDAGNWQGGVAPVSDASSTSGSQVVFGAFGNSTISKVILYTDSTLLYGVTFTSPAPDYMVTSTNTVGLGAGGLSIAGNASVELYVPIALVADQQWTNSGALSVGGMISEVSPGTKLTLDGGGKFQFSSAQSNFSGGLALKSGTLDLASSSILSGGTITSGPVGTGTLFLGNHTFVRSSASSVELHNAIVLGDQVTLGNYADRNDLNFFGTITPKSTHTTLRLGAEGAIFFGGNITNSTDGATSLVFSRALSTTNLNNTATAAYDPYWTPLAVLTGTNTYTGGTTADGAGVIFFAPGSVPATGNLIAYNNGYIGTGYSGGMTEILTKITEPGSFDGSLGFDTNPDLASTPTSFDDTINLASFAPDTSPSAGFWGLGSRTQATLSTNATITPPNGGNYVFGGGDGILFVAANLGAPSNSPTAGVRVRSNFGESPLTVVLQGNNTFTGNVMSDHSIVIFDSPTALPTNSHYSADSQAYVGYTDNTGWTPNQFLARLAPGSYNSDSILGFDTHSETGLTITESINASALSNVYFGTVSNVTLAGMIYAPGGRLALTSVDGGWLKVSSALLPSTVAGNVTSVVVGLPNPSTDDLRNSIVELTNAASTYSGGTTLNGGYLLVGASSDTSSGNFTSGPLGTGTLTFNTYNNGSTAALVASSPVVGLVNGIYFNPGSTVQFGVGQPQFQDDPANSLQDYSRNTLVLAGTLMGSPNSITFAGDGVFGFYGWANDLHAGQILIGAENRVNDTRVIVSNQLAFGNTGTKIMVRPGADIQFTNPSATNSVFQIGSISGGTPQGWETNDSTHLALDDGDTLVINQQLDGTLRANIGGVPAAWDNSGTTFTTASLVKNGTGTLTLSGFSTYSGGTVINEGKLIAASSSFDTRGSISGGPLGTGNIIINGGQLGIANFATIANPIVFGTAGGTLSGNATFETAITVGANVTLAPGNSPGEMTFNNGLTLAAGGTLSIDIANLYGSAGTDYDTLTVAGGTLDLTATSGNPFTIQINSLDALSGQIGPLSGNSDAPASLAIITTNSPIIGFDPSAFQLVSNFSSSTPGLFSLSLDGATNSTLLLNFSPVPEPSTYALLALGLGFVIWQVRRRRG